MSIQAPTPADHVARRVIALVMSIVRGSVVAPAYVLQVAASIFGIAGILMLVGVWRAGLDDAILSGVFRVLGVRDGRYVWGARDIVAFGTLLTFACGLLVALVRSIRQRTIVLPSQLRMRAVVRVILANTLASYTLFALGGNVAMEEPLGYVVPIVAAIITIVVSLAAFGADALFGLLQRGIVEQR